MTVDAEFQRSHRTAPRPSILARQGDGYRRDIDGLRAVAILLVVVYHVWVGRVSGGVDVFLMISAFFLTGSFVRRMDAGKPLAIGSFLLSRFRRLMPAASVVLAATLGACWLLLPQTAWPQLWKEGWASLGYVQNWVLAGDGVDYYAHDSALASPLQHFWSLSVQGQVFVLWPLLFLVGVPIVRWTRRSATLVMSVLFGLVFAGSLAFSIWETADLQTFAYFDTRARLWEFAAGSLLALALPRVRLPRILRAVLGWLGLVGLVVCGLVIDVRGGFPGYLALWPIISAALVIVAGTRPRNEHPELSDLGPGRLLATRPVLALGRDAYALYLVHWPILILWLTVREHTQASFLDGLLIIVVSLVLARTVTLLVERPLRLPAGERGRPWRNVGVIALCAGLVASVLTPWQVTTTAQAEALKTEHAAQYTGALGGDTAGDGKEVPLIPVPGASDRERWSRLDEPCTGRFATDIADVQESCTQTKNAATADHLVVVIGDSHANQFSGALRPVADERGWGVVMLMRPWCSLETHEDGTDLASYCNDWQRDATELALSIRPDALFTIITAATPDSPDERLITGASETVDRFLAEGIRTFGVRDNPRSLTNLWECAVNGEPCNFPVEQALAADNPAAALGDRIGLIDFTPWICPQGLCLTEMGHVAVYLDNNHLSYPFVKTLAPALDQQLGELLKS
ncbi:acyltransferase family protein [Microbacterium sp.]|uniref:acyltransferase family protein n=1 Tax=Microbacterium sp. TaxID=51671 RepID=UPI001AC4C8A3|nr:acyltransferase family protein [Microbacterium sp.]MBN9156313.1 acyltransferase [Microbacterium sp.]MBS1899168.1 acyltransferase [Actinomycetota bacterium]